MKRAFHSMLLGAIFLAALAGIIPTAQAAQCSPGSSAGNFGFALTGLVILPTGLFPSRLWVEQLWIQQETHPGQSLAAWAVDLPTRLSTEPLQ